MSASEAAALAVVERWARMRGWWYEGDKNPGTTAWHVERSWTAPGSSLRVFWQGSTEAFIVPPAVALAWAILVESEPPPVDVGPCPDCSGAGDLPGGANANWANPYGDPPEPCGLCDMRGRHVVPVARLFLDASSDPAMHTRLLVLADELHQVKGDTRGELLSYALAGQAHPDAVRWLEWLTWAREFELEKPFDDEHLARTLSRTTRWSFIEAREIVQAWRVSGLDISLEDWTNACSRHGLDALQAGLRATRLHGDGTRHLLGYGK